MRRQYRQLRIRAVMAEAKEHAQEQSLRYFLKNDPEMQLIFNKVGKQVIEMLDMGECIVWLPETPSSYDGARLDNIHDEPNMWGK